MAERFISSDGYPCAFSDSWIGKPLISALRSLPGGDSLDQAAVESLARSLYSKANLARDEELPRNRPAVQKKTDDELRKLADLADKLRGHIGRLHRPAVSALYQQGADIFTLAKALTVLQDQARDAFHEAEPDERSGGAPPKVEAFETAAWAAATYEQVTGKRPTYTAHPDTGAISGVWPDFLGKVFAGLHINASVEVWVKAVSEKTSRD